MLCYATLCYDACGCLLVELKYRKHLYINSSIEDIDIDKPS